MPVCCLCILKISPVQNTCLAVYDNLKIILHNYRVPAGIFSWKALIKYLSVQNRHTTQNTFAFPYPSFLRLHPILMSTMYQKSSKKFISSVSLPVTIEERKKVQRRDRRSIIAFDGIKRKNPTYHCIFLLACSFLKIFKKFQMLNSIELKIRIFEF